MDEWIQSENWYTYELTGGNANIPVTISVNHWYNKATMQARIHIVLEMTNETGETIMLSSNNSYTLTISIDNDVKTFTENFLDIEFVNNGLKDLSPSEKWYVDYDADGTKSIIINCTLVTDFETFGSYSINNITIELDPIKKTIVDVQSAFSDEDMLALYNGTAAIKTKLLVKDEYDFDTEIVLTEEDAIKSWNLIDERYVPDNGFLGQFVAKTLEGELHNISDTFNIENREVVLMIGIVRLGSRFSYLTTEDGTKYITTEDGRYIIASELDEDETTWYQLGTYIVLTPEDDEVADNTKFEAMDFAVKFNEEFNANYTDSNWSISFKDTVENNGSFTALQLAKYTCAQVGIEFANESFTNSEFEIDSNQFNTDNTCRDVMKAISQLAFGWVRIGWDDKCYIDELETMSEATVLTTDTDVIDYNEINNDHYYSLTTQKNNYGPINQVTVGMSSVVGNEGIIVDQNSIDTLGVNEIMLADNPITYTKELRDRAAENGYRLLGLTYAPFETETPGHPWLNGNELIKIVDMEGNVRHSYPFNRTIKYTGHIKTDIIAPAETKKEGATAYRRTLYKTIRDVSIVVDRQEGLIQMANSNAQASLDGLEKLERRVDLEITDTYSKTQIQEIISGTAEDGTVVSSVKSTSGTFDMDGLTIEQSEKPNTKTNVNGDGLIIYNRTGISTGDKLLDVNSNGVDAKNVKIERYLNIGKHSRIEDYTHTDYTEGTGVFWIGG